jgi:hypothetical protein
MLKLSILNDLPPRLLSATSKELADFLDGPTLIHLPGRRTEPLFVSVLLHGNEDVGLLAVQQVLREHADHPLPRALSIFIGNVEAAKHGVRRLENQPDYNRVWPGSDSDGTREHAIMREVVEEMRSRKVFASIDIHNNTGRNPHYACVNRLDADQLQLASLFGRTVVYFQRPHGVQSKAFSEFCPAVTCECGKVGDATGVAHAAEFVRSCLHLAAVPQQPPPQGEIHVFCTVATAKVKPFASIGFTGNPEFNPHGPSPSQSASNPLLECDVMLRSDLEDLNFQELPAGSLVGYTRSTDLMPLEVFDQQGRDATNEYLEMRDRAIVLRREVMPSMLTQMATVIRQDCLGYFMQRYNDN